MKIGITNRDPNTHPGGDWIQIEYLKRELHKMGVETETNTSFEAEWSNVDLVQVFHINFEWSVRLIENIQRQGKPYVVNALFYYEEGFGVPFTKMKELLEGAKDVTCFSKTEEKMLREATKFDGVVTIIPNGTDPMFFYYDTSSYREGVICVSARGGKGEEVVERICQNNNIPFKALHDLSRVELAKEYQKARVFVHNGTSEVMSLTTGEALCAGCRVIGTTHNPGNEWYPGLVIGVDLKNQIPDAYERILWNYEPNNSARMLTWPASAAQYLKIYERILL